MSLYQQGSKFYPFFQEPSTAITSVDLLIIRDDGYYNDFSDSTFKDSGWTTKIQALTEKTDGVWVWTTGWTVPTGDRVYRAVYKDNNGDVYEGDLIEAAIPIGIQKNVAISNFMFFMRDSADHISGKTGLTITAERSIDGAAFGACANSAAEIANGVYRINLAASDLNGNTITLKFTGTGADPTLISIVTQS